MGFLEDNNAIGLFIVIVAPGFISLKIWRLIHPSRYVSFADSLYEAVFYGVFNYFIIVTWFPPLMAGVHTTLGIIAYVISLVIVPVLLPFAWKGILNRKIVKNITINPIPRAWDNFFIRKIPCFMLIHLKAGQIIGGLYAFESAASSYPEAEDLYLQEVWEIDNNSKFIKPIEGTMGLLVNYNTVDYIELFKVEGE
jgi:hypothetical protein